MAIPSSVKIKKDGVEYLNNVDRVNYTINELTRAALKDVGKFICNRARKKLPRKTGRARKNLQYWVRRKQKKPDLQIGYKPGGFYGGFYEVGSEKTKKTAPIYTSIAENIATIEKIEGQYLSGISSEAGTMAKINESEVLSNDG
jgi:HK97 gp10 family phage protein